jgi:chromosome segregation ATPase
MREDYIRYTIENLENINHYHVNVIEQTTESTRRDQETISQLNKDIESLQIQQRDAEAALKEITAQRDQEREVLLETRKALDREVKWREKSLNHTCWACSDELEELRMQRNSMQNTIDEAIDSRNQLQKSQAHVKRLEEVVSALQLTAQKRDDITKLSEGRGDSLLAMDLAM